MVSVKKSSKSSPRPRTTTIEKKSSKKSSKPRASTIVKKSNSGSSKTSKSDVKKPIIDIPGKQSILKRLGFRQKILAAVSIYYLLVTVLTATGFIMYRKKAEVIFEGYFGSEKEHQIYLVNEMLLKGANPYSVIESEITQDQDIIKKKYRQTALKYHPDRPGGSTEKMTQINEAYDFLKSEYAYSLATSTKGMPYIVRRIILELLAAEERKRYNNGYQ